MRFAARLALALLSVSAGGRAQEKIFSGPQPGEPLPSFKVLAVNGPEAGREVDYLAQFGDAPILLVFAHYMDRNVYRVWWPCDRYIAERREAGSELRVLYVYLAPEKVAGERLMSGVVKSLSLRVPVGVSLEGSEGPGAYGLDKRLGVTAIVARNRKVVANLAIVQPGLTEAQKIIAEVVKVAGGRVPTTEELNQGPTLRMGSPNAATPPNGAAAAVPDFATRVQPMLVKAGCFSGACHGAGAGKGGFKLSLLGYDPELDYEAIVYQYRGRRINLVRPDDSLVLRKPTMQVVHLGGERFAKESETYRTVLAWIRGGAPFEGPAKRQITGLDAAPPVALAGKAGEKKRLRVTATFSDGSRDDVGAYALYGSNDESIASVDAAGEVTVLAPGETGISVRYMGLTRTARVGLPFAADAAAVRARLGTPDSFIDRLVDDNLVRLRILASARSTDAEFLRRACLDLIGRLPALGESRSFLSDARPDKRARLVDAVLERPEFGSYWSLWLLDLLRINSKKVGDANLEVTARWLRAELNADAPFGALARRLLTAVGNGTKDPAVNYLRQTNDPKLLAELTTESLMGSSSRCAQCHNHPFDSWTQTQYHQMVAFFVRIDRTENGTKLVDHGEIDHPKTGKPVAPGFPDGGQAAVTGLDRRTALADWLVSAENAYFARSIANRVWARLMGRGLVEPVDNLSVSNAPSNPELLDALAEYFKGRLEGHSSKPYSLKSLARAIVLSEAYQRSVEPNEVNQRDDRFYSRALARPLDAYAFADALTAVTGVAGVYGKLPEGTRAADVADPGVESYLLDVCGRCQREGSCDAPNTGGGGVRQALHVINGPALNARIAAPGGRLQALRARSAAHEVIAREFYLAALCREPSAQELGFWLSRVRAAKDPAAETEDLIWALLNSRAFIFNR